MIWKESGLTVIWILINVAIIKIVDIYNEKVFFALLTTLLFLGLAIYFVHHKK
jgi:hypothetical protein